MTSIMFGSGGVLDDLVGYADEVMGKIDEAEAGGEKWVGLKKHVESEADDRQRWQTNVRVRAREVVAVIGTDRREADAQFGASGS